MNQKGGETVGKLLELTSSTAAAGASLCFISVADMEEPPVNQLPKISSSDNSNETWYYINFTRSTSTSIKPVLQDMGDGQKLLTKAMMQGEESQLWKIIAATSPNGEYKYEIVNKSGRKIAYNTSLSRYTASSTTSALLKLTDVTPEWSIQRNGGGANGMNQNGGAGPNRELADYAYSEVGSLCLFIEAATNPVKTQFTENKCSVNINNKTVEIITEESVDKIMAYTVNGQNIITLKSDNKFELPFSGIYIIKVIYKNKTTETIKVTL